MEVLVLQVELFLISASFVPVIIVADSRPDVIHTVKPQGAAVSREGSSVAAKRGPHVEAGDARDKNKVGRRRD